MAAAAPSPPQTVTPLKDDLIHRETVQGTFRQFVVTLAKLKELKNRHSNEPFVTNLLTDFDLQFAESPAGRFDLLTKDALYGIQKECEWMQMLLTWWENGETKRPEHKEFFYRRCLQSGQLVDAYAFVAGIPALQAEGALNARHLARVAAAEKSLKQTIGEVGNVTPRIPANLLASGEFVGGGSQGEVSSYTLFTPDFRVAVKASNPDVGDSGSNEVEGKLLATLHHPSICHFHGFRVYEGKLAGIVLELLDTKKTLKQMLSSPALSFPHRMTYAYQLTKALCYIHGLPNEGATRSSLASRKAQVKATQQRMEMLKDLLHVGLVHGDLKAANAALSLDGVVAKWIDFGSAAKVDEAKDLLGTFKWLAPEIRLGIEKQFSSKTDVYSIGVTLFEFLTGEEPPEPRVADCAFTLEELKNLDPMEGLIPNSKALSKFKELIISCTNPDPDTRISLADVQTRMVDIACDSWIEWIKSIESLPSSEDARNKLQDCYENLMRLPTTRPSHLVNPRCPTKVTPSADSMLGDSEEIVPNEVASALDGVASNTTLGDIPLTRLRLHDQPECEISQIVQTLMAFDHPGLLACYGRVS